MKIVLAYSGGLDTSVALKWLQDQYSAEVIAFCADLGQIESLEDVKERATAAGASKIYVENLREDFLKNYAFKTLKAGAAYENRYLLAAPLSRPLIAKRLAEIAKYENADAVAHGATGKGNDQVRFYSSIIAQNPNLKIISPAIEWDIKSRDAEIEYAQKHNINIPITLSSPYSIDTNIWGTSIECGPLDDLTLPPRDEVYQITKSPQMALNTPQKIRIKFMYGVPISINDEILNPVELVAALNKYGADHGIGRIDILENRVVGIKTRGIYESPAATILHFAHKELDDLVLDRDTLHFKSLLSQKYSEIVYYGLWFSPLREALDAFIDYTQQNVIGTVDIQLFKGNLTVLSRESANAMYTYDLSTYDAHDKFDHTTGAGFNYIWSMPIRINSLRKQNKVPNYNNFK